MLRHHLIIARATPPGQTETITTACGRVGFKSARGSNVLHEFEAMAQIGGLVAMPAADFQPDRHSCARCRKAWGEGAGV